MMEARARILRVENGRAWLAVTDKQGGCGRCQEPGGCGSVQIAQAFGMPKGEFVLPADDRFAVGDMVVVSVPDGAPLRAALVSYGLATLLLVAGAALGGAIGASANADVFAFGGGLAGLALAWGINRVLPRSRNWRQSLHMELVPEGDCGRRLRVLQ